MGVEGGRERSGQQAVEEGRGVCCLCCGRKVVVGKQKMFDVRCPLGVSWGGDEQGANKVLAAG